ncbi:hypothetical protein SAMN04488602_11096 [Paenibacillus sp. cl123]|nr:hypothetical protein SAMN04488602_11096 [Paenibacillus sp. cl123]
MSHTSSPGSEIDLGQGSVAKRFGRFNKHREIAAR